MGARDQAGRGPLLRNLPNAISSLRIALVAVWTGLALGWASDPDPEPRRVALVALFAAMGLSDLLDGFLARRLHLASNLGATLDAVADKLAQVATVTFLALAHAPGVAALPRSLLLTLIARDLVLSVGWLVVRARAGRVDATHRWHGRLASTALFALVFAVLLGLGAAWVRPLSAGIALWVAGSTLAYLADGVRQLRGTRPVARGS